jgi:hypothetical protein
MTIESIAEEIDRLAESHEIGRLQEIRGRSHRRIFGNKTIKSTYAYHWGGQQELQFNIGFEAEGTKLRHGVAFSVESSPSFHSDQVKGVLGP